MLSEALGLALGEVVANERREAAREIAEARATIAELVARVATIERDVRQACTETALAAVRETLAGLRQPKDGRDGVTLEQLEPLITAIVVEKLAEQPPAEPGEPGKPGMLPLVRDWTDAVWYRGEVCTHGGATYQAIEDTGREPPNEDWRCIAAGGRDGVDGRSPDPRGLYDPDEAYRALDIVALNGSAFIAVLDDPGPCPGDGWKLLASRGKSGKPGEPGKPGTASAIALVGATVDDDGHVTLVNGDGSTVILDLYPLLDKVSR